MGSIAESAKAPVVCVFCGTSAGNSPSYLKSARDLAQGFHKNGIKLVYGGGTSGLMGALASELVRLSGPDAVHGIIPNALQAHERKNEIAEKGEKEQKKIDEAKYGKTTVVADMHTRKKTMTDAVLAGGPGSGFVALSGGYGTLEELMEIVTWNQLGILSNPVVLFNIEGYWDGLLQWVQKAVGSGFIAEGNSSIMAEASSAREVLLKLNNYEAAEGRLQLDWEEQKD